MRKNILITFFILSCFQYIQAQDPTIIRIYETMPAEIAKTESTHIIDIGLFGAGYNYEYAFAKKFTLNFKAGIVGAGGLFASNYFDVKWELYYAFMPYVSIEPRYYYNLQRQLNKGVSIDGNSGAFWSVPCSYILKPFAKRNTDYNDAVFVIAPSWGARKVFKYHFVVEFQMGFVFDTAHHDDSDSGFMVTGRIGYKF